jgi:hypothetical protein
MVGVAERMGPQRKGLKDQQPIFQPETVTTNP